MKKILNCNVISGIILSTVVNAGIFSLIFWVVTYILKCFYSNKNYTYKLNFYECGFKSLSNIKVQYNINFILIVLFLLIYDGEFLILIPLSLNINLINFVAIFLLFLFIILLIFTLLYDLMYNSLEWQV